MTIEFKEFPKIPRLNREIIITEKIDGTNACVAISDDGKSVFAQSRNRLITPENDNFGFARWVKENENELLILGPGHHYGEWWGKEIRRNYGLEERRFSLFNVSRWEDTQPKCCSVVPVIYRGPWLGNGHWSTDPDPVFVPEDAVNMLRWHGSFAVNGFMKPEGIVVFHAAGQILFKVTLEKDEQPKSKM